MAPCGIPSRCSSRICPAVSGPLLDPCGAVQASLTVDAGATAEVVLCSRRRRGRGDARAISWRSTPAADVRSGVRAHDAALERSARRRRGRDARYRAQHADQSVAGISDAQLPRLRAVSVLSVRWCVWLSRSAAGRAGAPAFRSRYRPRGTFSARRAASFQKGMFSTGGTNRAAKAFARESRTIGSGSCTPRIEYTRVTGDWDILDATVPAHPAAGSRPGRAQRVRTARASAGRNLAVRPLRARDCAHARHRRARTAADGDGRLERRHG